MYRGYLDTEFNDNGKKLNLISIGIVDDADKQLYLQSVEFQPEDTDPWVVEQVFPHLQTCPYIVHPHPMKAKNDRDYQMQRIERELNAHKQGQCIDQQKGFLYHCPWRTQSQIKQAVTSFFAGQEKFELWGWITTYDFFLLNRLFGKMIDLPSNFPHYMRDIQFLLDDLNLADDQLPPQEDREHNALADAIHIRKLRASLQEEHRQD